MMFYSSRCPTHLFKLTNKPIIVQSSSHLYTLQNNYVHKKVSNPKSKTLASEKFPIKFENSWRTIVLGGPGYTNFGHVRQKVSMSKFGYFWYAFLSSGIAFCFLFDFEDFMLRGEEPSMKLDDIQKYKKKLNPKAKSLNDDDVANVTDEGDNQFNAKDDDSIEKRNKAKSFRERKVILLKFQI